MLQLTATQCNALQHTATHQVKGNGFWFLTLAQPDTLQTLHHAATHCNTLQPTATHQVKGNGFWFLTLAETDSQELDALGFTVAVCRSNSTHALTSALYCHENDWKVVGSSRCLW